MLFVSYCLAVARATAFFCLPCQLPHVAQTRPNIDMFVRAYFESTRL